MDRAKNRNNVNEKVVDKETCIYPTSAGNTDQKVVADIPNMTIWKVSKTFAKEKERVTRYKDRTAGLLTSVRPCGIIVKEQEMYTCELEDYGRFHETEIWAL